MPSPFSRKKLLIETLLVALRSSEIARVVDVGTLEYFLDSSFDEMFHGTTFQLTRLWNILIAEPGIEPRMVFPPLLAYKAWERQLGVQVALPQPMLTLSQEERRAHEARCPVKATDLDRLLAARKTVVPKPPTAAAPRVAAEVPAVPAVGCSRRELPTP